MQQEVVTSPQMSANGNVAFNAGAVKPSVSFAVDDDIEIVDLEDSRELAGEHEHVKSMRFPFTERKQNGLPTCADSFSVVSLDDDETEYSREFGGRDEEAVSINLSTRNYTKLEIIQAKDISKLLWWIHSVIAFGLVFCIVLVILANTSYLRVVPGQDNIQLLSGLQARYYELPGVFEWIFSVVGMIGFVCTVSLAVLYSTRIFNLRRNDRTHEQVWVIMLTCAAALYINPFEYVVRLIRQTGVEVHRQPWYDPLSLFYDSMKDAAFSASTIFYVWASVHSYRVLDGKLGMQFYLPKTILVILYVFLKMLAYWRSRIYMSEMPFASFIAMIYMFGILHEWPKAEVIWITAITAFEITLVGLIIWEIRVTRRFLKTKDYMKYRTKQIGFRFFIYHALTFYGFFWLCYLLLLLGLPPGAQLAALKLLDLVYVEVQYVPVGNYVIYLSYVAVEAYANLPANAIGIRGWLHPVAPRATSDLAPITYRKREPSCLEISATCLVMETTVILFNFAWLVNYYDTSKISKLKKTPANFSYKVVALVKGERTDTHALIVDASDRIIVAFRGTKSARDMRLDLKAFHMKLRRVLPAYFERSRPSSATLDTVALSIDSDSAEDAEHAKVHLGFAEAYMSVSDKVISHVRHLYEEETRPVFLTGHSLGGALATICALDIKVSLNLDSEDICVTTFGMPRVGNASFAQIYNANIRSHWRVALAADIVSKNPSVGYKHVGKAVLLNGACELFIDPNALELSLWDGDRPSFLYHRKSAYLLAMRGWCRRHDSGSYRPPFWEWPYSQDDAHRFPLGVQEENVPTKDTLGKRIVTQDAMVDALDEDDMRYSTQASRAKYNWAKLTRRALLQQKLADAKVG